MSLRGAADGGRRGHIQTPNWSCDLPWRAIIVDETPTHCFLRLDPVTAYTIPKSAFRDEEEVQQFIDFARACVTRARIARSGHPG